MNPAQPFVLPDCANSMAPYFLWHAQRTTSIRPLVWFPFCLEGYSCSTQTTRDYLSTIRATLLVEWLPAAQASQARAAYSRAWPQGTSAGVFRVSRNDGLGNRKSSRTSWGGVPKIGDHFFDWYRFGVLLIDTRVHAGTALPTQKKKKQSSAMIAAAANPSRGTTDTHVHSCDAFADSPGVGDMQCMTTPNFQEPLLRWAWGRASGQWMCESVSHRQTCQLVD